MEMESFSDMLTMEEKEMIKNHLLYFIKRVSEGGYELPGEAFLALPSIIGILLYQEKRQESNLTTNNLPQREFKDH